MLVSSIDKKTIKSLSHHFSKLFVKQPEFMFYCSNIAKRQGFIYDYMRYFIPKLVNDGKVFVNNSADSMVTLDDPYEFEYKFKGLLGSRLNKYVFSEKVFIHRETLEGICETVVPQSLNTMVMMLYSDPNGNFTNAQQIIDEAIEYADKENITLVYDTFSKKYIDYMLSKGFVIAYNKPFMDTQFLETVMTYNIR